MSTLLTGAVWKAHHMQLLEAYGQFIITESSVCLYVSSHTPRANPALGPQSFMAPSPLLCLCALLTGCMDPILQMSRAAGSPRGRTWWCAKPPGGTSTWKGRPGSWTGARTVPAGGGGFCARPRCVLLPCARPRPGTRTLAATCVQVRRCSLPDLLLSSQP